MDNRHGLLFDARLMATIQPSFANEAEFFNSLLRTSQPLLREIVMFSHDASAKRQIKPPWPEDTPVARRRTRNVGRKSGYARCRRRPGGSGHERASQRMWSASSRLERGQIAERWRCERWDSLVANGPAWHDRFPGMEFADVDPDGFAPKEKVADYFVAYARQIAAPIRCGVDVTLVQRNVGRPGFRIETSDGPIEANNVVAATGPFQRPVMPALVPENDCLF